jgi:hypothetical protein
MLSPSLVILSEDIMILRLTTIYENGRPPLSPLGERVAHDGVFISRRGPGEGVPIFMAAKNARSSFRMTVVGFFTRSLHPGRDTN